MSADGVVQTFGYNCYGKGCSKEFDSLEEMVFVDGRDERDGRYFCPSCARDLRRTPEEAYGGGE